MVEMSRMFLESLLLFHSFRNLTLKIIDYKNKLLFEVISKKHPIFVESKFL